MLKNTCTILLFSVVVCPLMSVNADVDYVTQIKPLLAEKCYSCHGVLKQEAELRLETRTLMLKGGENGAAVIDGMSEDSLLLQRVTADEDSRMPPAADGSALKPEEIELLRRWINEGAKAPAEETPLGPRDHWAFQEIRKPALPTSASGENPIDVLLGVKRVERGVKVQSPAERSLLIRRIYLNLIGLPPSVDQLRDQRPWEQIVNDLLASPRHGERWGRHWMDVWRYSDWYGLGAQLRNSQKHIWHWRDWIVKSLNSDKGYDRMIHEMLAGDEIAPDDPEAIAGTGFLARNYYLFNRTTWLDSTIEHTGKAFLGLTLNCAKCHDHKYDPITHEDYYSFRAIFEPHQIRLDPVPGVTDFEKDGLPRAFDDHPDAETFLHRKGDPMNPDQNIVIKPRVPELFVDFQPQIASVNLPASAYAPGVRDYVQRDHLQQAEDRIKVAQQEFNAAKLKLASMPLVKPENSDETAEQSFAFVDDFTAANPDAWDLVGSDWKYENGTLLRATVTRDREFVRLRKPLPQDFEFTCRYITTGGATYKSVTFRFDESKDGRYANYVYTSAHAPGPKIQIAYSRNGQSTYPAEGQKAYPITVGETYELKFAVRGSLVNVWLDGIFQLAYQLPDRQPNGSLTLQAFDSTVAYDRVEIRSLPADLKLVDAKDATGMSPQDAKAAAEISAAKLHAAEASLKALQAVTVADNARTGGEGEATDGLALTAAKRQAEAVAAEAAYERLAAGTDAKKLKAADVKAKKAKDALAAVEKGDAAYVTIRASRKALEGPSHNEADYSAIYSKISTGRRTALAKWITAPQNPLAARVAVNHVWMRHFGQPLVESVFDFGLRAKKPLHADLLDYLAADFMEHNWSFKHLHRLIVMSATYRMSSSTLNADASTLATDPGNEYYWRMNARRMESQVVRDSILQLAGTLDAKIGGPSLEVGDESRRRSLYYMHSRDSQNKFLSMFDDADLLQCYRRSESIVPQQALALANSKVSMHNATQIADAITNSLESSDLNLFVSTAIETLLGRSSTKQEVRHCLQFCDDLKKLLQESATVVDVDVDLSNRIRTRLVHSLLNHNDFISIR